MADVFTTAGAAQIVDVYDANATTDYIGWGKGTTTAALGDTDLESPAIDDPRVAATRTQITADTIRWVGTITSAGTKTITEAGLFDAAGTGNPVTGGAPMLIHSVFVGQDVIFGDAIEFTFTWKLI